MSAHLHTMIVSARLRGSTDLDSLLARIELLSFLVIDVDVVRSFALDLL